MPFDLTAINTSAGVFAGVMVGGKCAIKGIPTSSPTLSDDVVLQSPCGTSMIYGYVLGAIREYHKQLRASLLVQGIDIGVFEGDED